MKKPSRLLSALMLVLALVLAGPGSSVAAHAGGSLTMMVICGEHGAETIWLDAAGNRVTPEEACANCVKCVSFVAGFLPEAPALPALLPHPRLPLRLMMAGGILSRPFGHERPAPRGPPSVPGVHFRAAESAWRAIVPASLEFRQVMRGQSVADRRVTT